MSAQTNVGEGRNSRHFSPLLRVALLLGVFVHLFGFFIFRVVSNPLPSNDEESVFIRLVETDSADEVSELMEQASLFDSAPLFIPGEWSSASEIFSTITVQDWEVFRDFEPEIGLMEEVRPTRLSLPHAANVKQPSDLLNLRFWKLFSYFGQNEADVEVPSSSHSVAQVRIITGGEKDFRDSDIRFEVDVASEQFAARPIIFFMNMAASGFPVGAPLLKQSSGSDALDAEVLEWLKRPTTLAKLPGGFLELSIFPK